MPGLRGHIDQRCWHDVGQRRELIALAQVGKGFARIGLANPLAQTASYTKILQQSDGATEQARSQLGQSDRPELSVGKIVIKGIVNAGSGQLDLSPN